MRFLFVFLFVLNLFGSDYNETNTTILSDTNITTINKTENNETNETQSIYIMDLPTLQEEDINSEVMDNNDYEMDIAVILDKDKFFKFIPNIMNSINAYMVQKDINYHIKLFNQDSNLTKELDEITPKYQYIFVYLTNSSQITKLNNYPDNYFFIPTLNKRQLTQKVDENIYFSGINYKQQVQKLNQYISGYTMIVYENNDLSKYITTIIDETLLQPHKIKRYPIKYSTAYDNTYVYLNTKVVNTAQILSNFTYHKITPSSILTTQIDYTPLIFSLTNPDDIENVIIANSIFDIPSQLEDNNMNLGSNIDFNWLNFTTSTLLNVGYNIETEENEHFLNDFNLHMFFNQVDYKTNLYKIYKNGFVKIEN